MAKTYLSEQLKAARVAAGLKQKDIYEWLGIGQSTFSAWETGQSEPSIGVFLRLCEKYHIVDVIGYFLPESEAQALWNDLDPDFLHRLQSLSPHGRAAVKHCLDFEYQTAQTKRIPFRSPRRLPVYTQVATAGRGSYLDDSHAEIQTLDAPEDADFAIRISGDSMEPMIHDGEFVFIRKQAQLVSGEVGVFSLNGESYCKMWDVRQGFPRLLSLNKNYPPILLKSSDQFHVYGKVLL